MRCLDNAPLWHKALVQRRWQKIFGYISGICFAIALLSMFDGLFAQMRAGNNAFAILPGETITLSGPAALKNPVPSDLLARFTPVSDSLSFELEGFFTGYWFGSGMWRGQVVAAEEINPGQYNLRISFRGASAKNTQNYIFTVYESDLEMRHASLSFIRRIFNVNPFYLATSCGIGAILCGFITFIFGRNYTLILRNLGLAQIWAVNDKDIWCLTPKELCPQAGSPRIILDENGQHLAEAQVHHWQKGKLHLTMLDKDKIARGSLVCLRHPGSYTHEE